MATDYTAETAAREMARCINVCDITMCCLLGVDPAGEVQADGPPMSEHRRMELARQLRQYDSGMQWTAYTQFYAGRYEERFREEDLARDYEQEGEEERAERQRNKSRQRVTKPCAVDTVIDRLVAASAAASVAANRERMARESDATMCDMLGLDVAAELDAAGSLTDERRVELARQLRDSPVFGGYEFYQCFFAPRYESRFAAEDAERERLQRQRQASSDNAWRAMRAANGLDY